MWTNMNWRGPRGAQRMLQVWALVVVILGGSLLLGCAESGAPSPDSGTVESATSAPAPGTVAAVDSAEPATLADLFPDGPGRSLVLDSCGGCHAVACSAIGQRTPARWDNLKEDHRDKVANLSEKALETTFAYLKEHFNDSKPEPSIPAHFLAAGCTPF